MGISPHRVFVEELQSVTPAKRFCPVPGAHVRKELSEKNKAGLDIRKPTLPSEVSCGESWGRYRFEQCVSTNKTMLAGTYRLCVTHKSLNFKKK